MHLLHIATTLLVADDMLYVYMLKVCVCKLTFIRMHCHDDTMLLAHKNISMPLLYIVTLLIADVALHVYIFKINAWKLTFICMYDHDDTIL